jgi:hypothetical protein
MDPGGNIVYAVETISVGGCTKRGTRESQGCADDCFPIPLIANMSLNSADCPGKHDMMNPDRQAADERKTFPEC